MGTLAQNSHSVHEHCDNVEQNIAFEFLIFFWEKVANPFFLSTEVVVVMSRLWSKLIERF